MKIEQTFSFWIDRTARMMKYFASTKANELNLGITIDQWVVLAMISQFQNISQAELGEKTFKDKASIARISDILEKNGYIIRTRNPDNRREYMLTSTKPGIQKAGELLPYVQEAREIGIKGLTEKELTTLVSILQKIYTNYEKAMNDNSDES